MPRGTSGADHCGACKLTVPQVPECVVCSVQRIWSGGRLHTGLRRNGQKIAGILPGQIGDRDDLTFLPEKPIRKARDVAHMDAAADHPAALADVPQGDGD